MAIAAMGGGGFNYDVLKAKQEWNDYVKEKRAYKDTTAATQHGYKIEEDLNRIGAGGKVSEKLEGTFDEKSALRMALQAMIGGQQERVAGISAAPHMVQAGAFQRYHDWLSNFNQGREDWWRNFDTNRLGTGVAMPSGPALGNEGEVEHYWNDPSNSGSYYGNYSTGPQPAEGMAPLSEGSPMENIMGYLSNLKKYSNQYLR